MPIHCKEILSSTIEKIMSWFYPNKCLFCRSFLEKGEPYFCPMCLSRLKDEQAYWFRNVQFSLQRDEEILESLGIDLQEGRKRIIAVFSYEGMYRKAILRWKYRGLRGYANGFAKLVEDRLETLMEKDIQILIPVPLASSRQRSRGFNQAKDLALALADTMNRDRVQTEPMWVWDCLKRIRDTAPQTTCSKGERAANVKGSIEFNPQRIQNQSICVENIRKIAVVDDIYTTGSTMNECIRVLKNQECFKDSEIYAIILGRGSI